MGASFSTEQDLEAKEMQQGSHEGQTSMAHAARFPGHVEPARSPPRCSDAVNLHLVGFALT
jgi:hypothetical protein